MSSEKRKIAYIDGKPYEIGPSHTSILKFVKSYIGEKDSFGNELNVTQIAIADELSAAAELVMGKAENIPIAIIKNFKFIRSDRKIDEVIRKESEDYFL